VRRFSKRTIHIAIGAALVALIGLAATLLIVNSADTGGQAWVERNIEEYRATLAVSTNPTEQAFLQQKLNAMEQIQANRLQALRNLPTKPADPCEMRPTPEPTTVRPATAGISLASSVPISPDDFISTTQWQGEWAGLWVRVYAGAYAGSVDQGVLWIVVDNTGDWGNYDSPMRGGALTVTAAEGLVLTLKDASGAQLYFDVASRQFLSYPNAAAATLVPMPTFTPDTGLCPANLP